MPESTTIQSSDATTGSFVPRQVDEPVRVIREDSASPCLFLCDHASNRIPAFMNSLGVAEGDLERHLAYDIGALSVADRLAARFDSRLVHSTFSRLIVDPNRFPDDPTFIPRFSDGVEVPGNEMMGADEKAWRVATFFEPYHRAVGAVIDGMIANRVTPVIISIHSFTPQMGGYHRPWHFGVLWHPDDGRLAVPLLDSLNRQDDYVIGDNQPYHAIEPRGYTVETHALSRGLPHLLIEIRQDLVGSEAGCEVIAAFLGDQFERLFAGQELTLRSVRAT